MKKTVLRILSALTALVMAASILTTASAQGGEDEIRRVCVVFNGDADSSRGLSWYTGEKCGSVVQIKPASEYSGSFDGAAEYRGSCTKWKGGYSHKVTVSSLAPGTEYVYRVGDRDSGVWSSPGRFETDSSADSPFSFIAIADVQASSAENFAYSAKVLEAAFNAEPDAAFVMNAGDFVNDCTDEEWDWFFEKNESVLMNTTLAPAAGNHEGNLRWGWFNNMFNLDCSAGMSHATGVYYSFDYSNVHVAVLNTNDMYPISEEQLNWLRNDMSASDAQWKIVLMHRALYSAGKNINKPDTLIMRRRLLPVIDELGIDVVVAGHDHMYLRTKQVKDDKAVSCTYISEEFRGERVNFTLDPEGTVHILPNTAGTKRYQVNADAMAPILENAAVAEQPGKSVFSTFTIDGGRLVYRAYTVDINSGTMSVEGCEKIDEYAIMKTEPRPAVNKTNLPTSALLNLPKNILNLPIYIAYALVKYITLLPTLTK